MLFKYAICSGSISSEKLLRILGHMGSQSRLLECPRLLRDNLVLRNFSREEPDKVRVGDMDFALSPIYAPRT